MQNRIKILSLLVLVVFAISFAAPLLSHSTCDMECCAIEQPSCHVESDSENCCESMSECNVETFIPIPTAPLNKVDVSKDLIVEFNSDYSEKIHSKNDLSHLWTINKDCSIQVHSGFQIPLLI